MQYYYCRLFRLGIIPFSFRRGSKTTISKAGLENVQPDGSIKPFSNLDGKTDIENLFFEDFNAPVEYFFEREFIEVLGLRIVRDSSDRYYLLEVKSIPKFQEVNRALEKEYPSIGTPLKDLDTVTDSMIRQSVEHNLAMYAKCQEEGPEALSVETRTFRIGERVRGGSCIISS